MKHKLTVSIATAAAFDAGWKVLSPAGKRIESGG
jgi:hypothetical protein